MSLTVESSYTPTPVTEWAKTAPIKTIPELFRQAITKRNAGPVNYLGAKVNGVYKYITYNEAQQRIHQFACALIDLGLQPGDRAALISTNRPEWPITDLGIIHAGCIHAPLYPTISEEAIEYILKDSGSRLVVCSTDKHLRAIVSVEKDLPGLEHIVSMAPIEGVTSTKKLWAWDAFLAHGKECLAKHSPEMEKRIAAIDPTDVCSLVYTSGTTGEPKGAMLMHGNFVSNCVAVIPVLNCGPGDVELSFLPLSHVFERTAYYALTGSGCTICYAESIDTVAQNMNEVHPSIVPSVPRLFEKIHGRVLDGVKEGSALKQALFHKAMAIGKKYHEAKMKGNVPGWLTLAYQAAFKVVLKKLHARTGGKIKMFCSGGAPLRRDVGEFFLNAGFRLVEGYGLTETSPIITINPPDRPKMGTVGKVIPGVECKIAADGEIITRGPHVMRGYFNKPQATKDAINEEGWFHTGDIGQFDEDGYLAITDRKKDLLVMSNGKNVAPQPIEQAIKSSPYIEMAVVLGDNKKFVAALVVPTYTALASWAQENGVANDPKSLAASSKLNEFLTQECQKLCADFSAYEQVKKIAVLEHELSQENGEMTPTLKVKRKVVNQRYADKIHEIYGDE